MELEIVLFLKTQAKSASETTWLLYFIFNVCIGLHTNAGRASERERERESFILLITEIGSAKENNLDKPQ